MWEKRPGIARDLINSNFFIGKSYKEVNEILGDNEIDGNNNSISYEVYVEAGTVDPIFIESLFVYFDESNKVKNAEIKIKMMDGHPDYR